MNPTRNASKEEDEPQVIPSSGWRPEPGDVVSGRIVAVSRGWSDWTNSYYPLVTIHDDAQDRNIDVHCFHQTLESRLMEVRPKVGERLEIVYHGKTQTKDGKRTVAIYSVTCPDATGQEVWDALDRQPTNAAKAGATGQAPADDDIPF